MVEEGSSEDEKDTEDEGRDEKALILDARSPPSLDPPISASTAPPLVVVQSPVTRAQVIPCISSEPSIFLAPTSSTSTSLTAIPLPAAVELSRTPTPTSLQRKALLNRPKTLVLDLDETLIHSTSRPMPYSSGGILSSFGFGKRNKGSGYTVEVTLGGHSTVYHVYKRPFVDYFLRKVGLKNRALFHQTLGLLNMSCTQVSAWYTLVIFTASMREYADPVIDWLDAGRGILERRFFREVRSSTHLVTEIMPG